MPNSMSNPNKAEKAYHDRLCNECGCVVCRLHLGIINTYCSIHHVDGRTKKGAHMNVLPLCFSHHQGGEGIGIHPFKRVWEYKFGTQAALRQICNDILEADALEVGMRRTLDKVFSDWMDNKTAEYQMQGYGLTEAKEKAMADWHIYEAEGFNGK